MDEKYARRLGYSVIAASWLAVFCLFGFRSSFSILNPVMIKSTGWAATLPSTGYSIMMSVYAITAFFSGMIIDKHGTRPAYFLGAIFCALYVSKDWNEDRIPHKVVPERRPPERMPY